MFEHPVNATLGGYACVYASVKVCAHLTEDLEVCHVCMVFKFDTDPRRGFGYSSLVSVPYANTLSTKSCASNCAIRS